MQTRLILPRFFTRPAGARALRFGVLTAAAAVLGLTGCGQKGDLRSITPTPPAQMQAPTAPTTNSTAPTRP